LNSFKFSTRHLLVVVAAAAFAFWFVKNYYDSQQLAESQAQLRAARCAGSIYLYDKLLSDKSVIGKKIADIPGLTELSLNPAKVDDRKLAEVAIEYGKLVRWAPAIPAQAAPAPTASAEGKSADSQQKPAVTYVSGDRVLYFDMDHGALLQEGSHTTGFFVYIRDDKILAIFEHVTRVPS
jgi:hypothetical protein